MKSICFLVGNLNNSGGTERVTSLIANELVKEGFLVSILNLEDGSSPFFNLDSRIHVECVYPKKVSYKLNFIQTVWKIRKYVLRNKIDNFIVVDSISCVLTVPALFGVKINHICWEHFNFNENIGLKFRDLGRIWAAKYCNYVVTLTKRDKELWEQGLKKIKARIITITNPNPYENTDNIPKLEYKCVLAAGRYTYQKGFDLLINAWAEVCKENNDWTLKIVGSGEDKVKLLTQAKELGVESRIKFINSTKNIDQFYKTSSFYCFSSRFEGLGMVLLEAQAFGLPLVSFECDCGPSDIITHGENGYLVPKENYKMMAEQITKIMEFSNEEYLLMSFHSIENSRKYNISQLKNKWLNIL